MDRPIAVAAAALILLGCGAPDRVAGDLFAVDLPLADGPLDAGADLADAADSNDGAGDRGLDGLGGDGPGDGAPDAPDFQVGPHATLPQIPDQGGDVLQNVQLVTVTFGDDPDRAQREAFGEWIVTSDWLAAVGEEYGVGPGTHQPGRLSDPTPASTSDSAIQMLLTDRIRDGSLPVPPAGASDFLYMVYFPSTTVVDDGGLRLACAGLGGQGYHWDLDVDGARISYGISIGCPTGPLAELDDSELGASHEIIEAITDAHPSVAKAWSITNPNDPWSVGGGETADLCLGQGLQDPAGFWVQRVWSNRAAQAGGPPCIPVPPDTPYFNVTAARSLLPITAGQQARFTLQGWSTAPVSPWKLQALLGGGTLRVQVALDRADLQNGQSATLTVTAPSQATSGQFAVIQILSQRDPANFAEYANWPVAVYVP
jgi:hypothetical protein